MFRGSMVALATPMTDEGGVDSAALAALIEFHIENDTQAIVAVGTTGESATLDEREHCDVIRQTVEIVNGRVPVIAGTGSNSTVEAINLTRCAKQAGADACLLVTPYYNKPTQEGLYQHYKAIAEAVDVPQILYNVPGRTAVDMQTDAIARLAKLPNVIGIKDATGDIARVKPIMDACGPDFELYSGDDATAMDFLLLGGHGVISVTANVAPKVMQAMCAAALAGDKDKAKQLNDHLIPLHRDLFLEANPIPVKWALHEMGLMGLGIRLPLTVLSPQYHDAVREAMRQASLAI